MLLALKSELFVFTCIAFFSTLQSLGFAVHLGCFWRSRQSEQWSEWLRAPRTLRTRAMARRARASSYVHCVSRCCRRVARSKSNHRSGRTRWTRRSARTRTLWTHAPSRCEALRSAPLSTSSWTSLTRSACSTSRSNSRSTVRSLISSIASSQFAILDYEYDWSIMIARCPILAYLILYCWCIGAECVPYSSDRVSRLHFPLLSGLLLSDKSLRQEFFSNAPEAETGGATSGSAHSSSVSTCHTLPPLNKCALLLSRCVWRGSWVLCLSTNCRLASLRAGSSLPVGQRSRLRSFPEELSGRSYSGLASTRWRSCRWSSRRTRRQPARSCCASSHSPRVYY